MWREREGSKEREDYISFCGHVRQPKGAGMKAGVRAKDANDSDIMAALDVYGGCNCNEAVGSDCVEMFKRGCKDGFVLAHFFG